MSNKISILDLLDNLEGAGLIIVDYELIENELHDLGIDLDFEIELPEDL